MGWRKGIGLNNNVGDVKERERENDELTKSETKDESDEFSDEDSSTLFVRRNKYLVNAVSYTHLTLPTIYSV